MGFQLGGNLRSVKRKTRSVLVFRLELLGVDVLCENAFAAEFYTCSRVSGHSRCACILEWGLCA